MEPREVPNYEKELAKMNRVSKDVWIGADRIKTTGDLLLQLQQVVERYGADKPIYFSVGRGVVGRRLNAIGECWLPPNQKSVPADCDGVFFMISAKGVESWIDQQRDQDGEGTDNKEVTK